MLNLIEELLAYGLKSEILNPNDLPLARNMMFNRLGILELPTPFTGEPRDAYEILSDIADKLSLTFIYQRDQLYAELTSFMIPRNNENSQIFWKNYKEVSPEFAAKRFYQDSINSTYIRMDRVSKNWVWTLDTDYGQMDITINMTKPEKSPEEILLMKSAKQVNYPKCMLCTENVGFAGTQTLPPRHNLRTVQMELGGESWQFQYSPYVYYNEHGICFSSEHRPMKIDRECFVRLLDFVDILPHYFIGSNADLHTVGGSILTHDHYQAGSYEMPMFRAKVLKDYGDFDGVNIKALNWPLSVLKLSSVSKDKLLKIADLVFTKWVDYSDEKFGLFSYTNERHNTVTPIARKEGEEYVLFLALRNNRADDMHPMGIFHPHAQHHHIKRENIGLIEVMGLAVLPSRLTEEISHIISFIKGGERHPELEKHLDWLQQIMPELDSSLSDEQLVKVLKNKVGLKFVSAIEDSGIFKGDVAGFDRFITSSLNS